MLLSRRKTIVTAALGLALGIVIGCAPRSQAAQPVIEVYRSINCGCCAGWTKHLRAAGFTVTERLSDNLAPIKVRLGVPSDLQSCHTGLVDGYVVEGHIPAVDVKRMLAERPNVVGIAVAGMPVGSPGMEAGGQYEPYNVIAFGTNTRTVFARH